MDNPETGFAIAKSSPLSWRRQPRFQHSGADILVVPKVAGLKTQDAGLWAEKGRELVLLLLGGDKRSQKEDIKRAQEFWSRYLQSKE